MRKIILILLVVLAACSAEDNEVQELNPVGIWQFQKVIIDGTTYLASNCMSEMTFNLKENGNVDHNRVIYLFPVDPDGECIDPNEEYDYYIWEKGFGDTFILEYKLENEEPVSMDVRIKDNTMKVNRSSGVVEHYIKM